MSYILDALRKMEQHKRIRESRAGSWMEDLMKEPTRHATSVFKRNRLVVVLLILMGVFISIFAGLFFQHPNRLNTSGIKIEAPETSEPLETRIEQEKTVHLLKENPVTIRGEHEEISSPAKPRGITLSDVMLPSGEETLLVNNNSVIDAGDRKGDVHGGEKRAPVGVSPETVDLTNRFKLSSTGVNDNGKYATLEGDTYYVGDEFQGMIITRIQQDRVFLKEKKTGDPYVVIFRYNK